jgi:hypothetical protein
VKCSEALKYVGPRVALAGCGILTTGVDYEALEYLAGSLAINVRL